MDTAGAGTAGAGPQAVTLGGSGGVSVCLVQGLSQRRREGGRQRRRVRNVASLPIGPPTATKATTQGEPQGPPSRRPRGLPLPPPPHSGPRPKATSAALEPQMVSVSTQGPSASATTPLEAQLAHPARMVHNLQLHIRELVVLTTIRDRAQLGGSSRLQRQAGDCVEPAWPPQDRGGAWVDALLRASSENPATARTSL